MIKSLLFFVLFLVGCGQLPALPPANAKHMADAVADVRSAVDRSQEDLERLREVVAVGCKEPAKLPADICVDGQSSWNHLAADYESVIRPRLEQIEAVLRMLQ